MSATARPIFIEQDITGYMVADYIGCDCSCGAYTEVRTNRAAEQFLDGHEECWDSYDDHMLERAERAGDGGSS